MELPLARSFLKAFLASALGTGLSRVLGAVRDIAIASFLGAGAVSDAFLIAFTIPNTFRRFVADEGLTGALVPAIAREEQENGLEAAKVLANTLLTGLLLVNVALLALGWFGAESVVKAFAYSFTKNPEQFALTVQLTRGLFPFLALVSLVSFAEGILNHRGRFFLAKLAPGLVSIGTVGAIFFADRFPLPVYALVAGTLVGGVAHLALVVPQLIRVWGLPRLGWAFGAPRVQRVGRELGKVVVIGLFAQINILVLRQLASSIEAGAVTWYSNATHLVDLAQGMIAIGIGSALLPSVSASIAGKQWDQFRKELTDAMRLAGFVLIPTAVGLIGFGTPLTAILLRHGRYTPADVAWTADTLTLLTPFLLAVAAINILKKVFFALEDRNPLLTVGAVGVVITGAMGWFAVGQWSVAGLALALSASTVTQLALYLLLLWRRLGAHLGLSTWALAFLKMALATVPFYLFLLALSPLGSWELGPAAPRNWLVFSAGILGSVLLYGLTAWAMRLEELTRVSALVRRKLGR